MGSPNPHGNLPHQRNFNIVLKGGMGGAPEFAKRSRLVSRRVGELELFLPSVSGFGELCFLSSERVWLQACLAGALSGRRPDERRQNQRNSLKDAEGR